MEDETDALPYIRVKQKKKKKKQLAQLAESGKEPRPTKRKEVSSWHLKFDFRSGCRLFFFLSLYSLLLSIEINIWQDKEKEQISTRQLLIDCYMACHMYINIYSLFYRYNTAVELRRNYRNTAKHKKWRAF